MGTTTTETSGELAGPAAAVGLGLRMLCEGVTADLMAVTRQGAAVLLLRCDGEPIGWLREPRDRSWKTQARTLDMADSQQQANAWQGAAWLCEQEAQEMERQGLELLAALARPDADGLTGWEREHGLDRLDRAARLRDRAAALDRG